MLLDKMLVDNSILVIPSNIKKNVLAKINELDTIYNIKIMSKEELINSLSFTYDEKAIYYLMHYRQYKYDIALMYLNNLRYIDSKLNNKKVNTLKEIKEELDANNLLIYNQLRKDNIKDKKIIICGYDYLTNYEKKILADYNYDFIDEEYKEYKHTIYKFDYIDQEIEYVAYKIASLIKSGVDINNIKVANINNEYFIPMKRIFDLYNIPLEDINNSSIYETNIIQQFLTNLDFTTLDIDLNDDNNLFIYNNIIKVLNKYNYISDLEDVKDLLIQEFKSIKNKTIKKDKEINIISINDNIIDDDKYVFFMNFNQGYAPSILRDDDYFSSKEKSVIGLENHTELNNINKEILKNKLNSIKNLFITYKLKSAQENYEISYLADELDYELVEDVKIEKDCSNLANKFNLAMMLDELIKYQNSSDELNTLYSNYQDIPYLEYDNKFKGLNKNDLYNYLGNELTLSYSAIDNYYKCGFRFYLNNILKINKDEDTFITKIGNIFHDVLEKTFKYNTPFDQCYNDALAKYELDSCEKFFLKKLKEDLIFIIDTIKKQNSYSKLDNYLCEEKVFVNKDGNVKLTFKGFIDKLMYKEIDGVNYAVIVDYKTGKPDVDLNNVYYGLGMQLPIYVYLANNISKIKNIKIVGFYLQKIIHSKPKKDSKKDLNTLKEEELKLEGYTTSNLNDVELIDSNYEDSKVIKGFKTTKDGSIYSNAKVLSELELNNLVKLTERKIDEAFTNILDANFKINPKQIDNNNIGCKYCPYKDVCFKKEDDLVVLDKMDYKEFLKEGD